MDAFKKPSFWIGVVLCVPVGIAALLAIEALLDIKALDLNALIALFAGLLLFLMAVMVLATSLPPSGGVKRSHSVFAALSLAGCGVVLIIPPLAPSSIDARVMFGLFVAVLALSYLPPLLARREADEMDRRITAEASLIGYHLFGLAVLLYGGASALGLNAPIDLWALVAVMTVVQLFVSAVVAQRRAAPLPEE